jgi:hypothetical protein
VAAVLPHVISAVICFFVEIVSEYQDVSKKEIFASDKLKQAHRRGYVPKD